MKNIRKFVFDFTNFVCAQVNFNEWKLFYRIFAIYTGYFFLINDFNVKLAFVL